MRSTRMVRFWSDTPRPVAEPFVFFSYGMTKCGSTLAFQLARVALLQAGFEQPVLPLEDYGRKTRINAVTEITPRKGQLILGAVRELGHPLVVKTHRRPDPKVVKMIQHGNARAHAVFRDPRDMALSMLDHGKKARARGKPAFSEIATLDDARAGIANQLDSLTAWLQLPGVRRLQYETLAFDTETAAASILDHLGIPGDPRRIARQVLKREFTQANQGIPARHKTQMSAEDSDRFRRDFAPVYDLLLDKPDPGTPLPLGTSLKSGLDSNATLS